PTFSLRRVRPHRRDLLHPPSIFAKCHSSLSTLPVHATSTRPFTSSDTTTAVSPCVTPLPMFPVLFDPEGRSTGRRGCAVKPCTYQPARCRSTRRSSAKTECRFFHTSTARPTCGRCRSMQQEPPPSREATPKACGSSARSYDHERNSATKTRRTRSTREQPRPKLSRCASSGCYVSLRSDVAAEQASTCLTMRWCATAPATELNAAFR